MHTRWCCIWPSAVRVVGSRSLPEEVLRGNHLSLCIAGQGTFSQPWHCTCTMSSYWRTQSSPRSGSGERCAAPPKSTAGFAHPCRPCASRSPHSDTSWRRIKVCWRSNSTIGRALAAPQAGTERLIPWEIATSTAFCHQIVQFADMREGENPIIKSSRVSYLRTWPSLRKVVLGTGGFGQVLLVCTALGPL